MSEAARPARGLEILLLPDRTLLRETVAPASQGARARARRDLRAAYAATERALATTSLPDTTKRAVRNLLLRARQPDGSTDNDPAPHVARRLLRHGWLDRVLPELPTPGLLASALRSAETPRRISSP